MEESPKREASRSEERDICGEKISNVIADVSVALNTLIRSIAVTIEEKVALENRVKKISREADYVVNRIDDIAREIRRCSRCYCCLCIQEIAETERGFSE